MFNFNFQFLDRFAEVTKEVKKAAFRNYQHAAAAIRLTAIRSIKTQVGPSSPGSPPHTQPQPPKGKRKKRRGALRKSIVYDVSSDGAIIGPRESVVGTVGELMEKGGTREGQSYDARPFMLPALEKNLSRFADSWQGSIGGGGSNVHSGGDSVFG